VVARSAPPLSWMAVAIAGAVGLVIAGAIAGILYARDGDDDVTTPAARTTTDNSPPPPPRPIAKISEGPPELTNDPTAFFDSPLSLKRIASSAA
jgi:hypothetical protein